MFGDSRPGVAIVDDLVTRVERVHVDAELAKERTALAIDSLRALVTLDFGRDGDAVQSFAAFVESIDAAEQQADALRSSVAQMKESAALMFDRWESNIDSFQNETLRAHSQTRLQETQRYYDAIVAAVDPAQSSCDVFNSSLRDHALFLEHDFNATSIATIADGVRDLRTRANDIRQRLDVTLTAARAYFESRALPTRVAETERAGSNSAEVPASPDR